MMVHVAVAKHPPGSLHGHARASRCRRANASASSSPDRRAAGIHGRRPEEWSCQARDLSCTSPLFRDAPPGKRRRHPHHSGAARPHRPPDDDDLYARRESRASWCGEPGRQAVKGRLADDGWPGQPPCSRLPSGSDVGPFATPCLHPCTTALLMLRMDRSITSAGEGIHVAEPDQRR
jgi:hypothetical protein